MNVNEFITNLVLDASLLVGNPNGNCILLGCKEWKEYVDGKATGNTIGIKANVGCPKNMYQTLEGIKIKGAKMNFTNEQLREKGGQPIVLKGLQGKFYRDNTGEYKLSCTADGFEVVS